MIYVMRAFKHHISVSWTYRKAFQEAVSLADRGQYQESERVFSELVQKGGEIAEALLHRAHIRMRMGSLQDALSDAQQAVELRPENGVYFMVLGEIQTELSDWAAAYASFKKAAELEKENGRALFGLGKAALHLGRKFEAADYFESALQFERDYVMAQWMVEGLARRP